MGSKFGKVDIASVPVGPSSEENYNSLYEEEKLVKSNVREGEAKFAGELEDADSTELLAKAEDAGAIVFEGDEMQSLKNIGEECYKYLQTKGHGKHPAYLKRLSDDDLGSLAMYSERNRAKVESSVHDYSDSENELEVAAEELNDLVKLKVNIAREGSASYEGAEAARKELAKYNEQLVEEHKKFAENKAYKDFKNELPSLTAEQLEFAKSCADYLISDGKMARPKSPAVGELNDLQIKLSANEYGQYMLNSHQWFTANFSPKTIDGKIKLVASREAKDKQVKQINLVGAGDKLMPAGNYYFKNKFIGAPDKEGKQKVLAEILFERMTPEAKKVFSDSVKDNASKKFVRANQAI